MEGKRKGEKAKEVKGERKSWTEEKGTYEEEKMKMRGKL